MTPNNKTGTVLRNSIWYGIESVSCLLASFVATVVVARVLGPERIAYYNYLNFLILGAGSLSALGLPSSARKYMAESFGRGDPPIALAVFRYTLRVQIWIGIAIVVVGSLVACLTVLPGSKVIACLLISGMLPRLMGFVASQANNAVENMRANVPGAIAGTAINLLAVVLSLWLSWGLIGLAAGTVLSQTVECVLKLKAAWSPLRHLPRVALPPELRIRMREFSGKSLVLMLLNIIVWDRSDLIILRWLGKNLVDLTFFTLSFTITERLLVLPQVFQSAVGVTVMVEYGRSTASLAQFLANASRYALLMGTPLLIGAAALSPALVRAVYGSRYDAVIPLLGVMALFAIPKSLLPAAQMFLEANERQSFLIYWLSCCGVWNVAADILLIPHLGAMGAAWGNGTTQLIAVSGVWIYAIRRFNVPMPYSQLARIALSSAFMGIAVLLVASQSSGLVALLVGFVTGVISFSGALWGTRALQDEDVRRLRSICQKLPGRAGDLGLWILLRIARAPAIDAA